MNLIEIVLLNLSQDCRFTHYSSDEFIFSVFESKHLKCVNIENSLNLADQCEGIVINYSLFLKQHNSWFKQATRHAKRTPSASRRHPSTKQIRLGLDKDLQQLLSLSVCEVVYVCFCLCV